MDNIGHDRFCDADEKLEYDEKNEESNSKIEWADTNTAQFEEPSTSYGAFLMMRMSSHFIIRCQPKLDKFVQKNLTDFCTGQHNSAQFSVAQFDIFKKYTQIFETCMAEFTNECANTDILSAIKEAQRSTAAGKESMCTIMIDLLDAVSNFEGNENCDDQCVIFGSLISRINCLIVQVDFSAMMYEEWERQGRNEKFSALSATGRDDSKYFNQSPSEKSFK